MVPNVFSQTFRISAFANLLPVSELINSTRYPDFDSFSSNSLHVVVFSPFKIRFAKWLLNLIVFLCSIVDRYLLLAHLFAKASEGRGSEFKSPVQSWPSRAITVVGQTQITSPR